MEKHKTYSRGRLLEVLEPSPERIQPPCPLFQRCGGCATQHLAYPAEVRAKVAQIEGALRRIGKIADPVLRPALTGPDFGYRNRITVHNRDGKIGFLGTDGKTLVDVPRCLLAAEDVNAKLGVLRSRPRPRPHYSVRADEVRGEAFYQSNRPLGPALKKLVAGAVPAGVKSVLEGYAGTGFFTAAILAKAIRVVAVESGAAAAAVFRKEVPRPSWWRPGSRMVLGRLWQKSGRVPRFVCSTRPAAG